MFKCEVCKKPIPFDKLGFIKIGPEKMIRCKPCFHKYDKQLVID